MHLQWGLSRKQEPMASLPVAANSAAPVTGTPSLLELVALKSLPCGCVAAAFRAKPWDLALVSIEAKGPHCLDVGHHQEHALELGKVSDLFAGDGEE